MQKWRAWLVKPHSLNNKRRRPERRSLMPERLDLHTFSETISATPFVIVHSNFLNPEDPKIIET